MIARSKPSEHIKEQHILGTFSWILTAAITLFLTSLGQAQEETCVDCHELGKHETVITEDLARSSHSDLDCIDCHIDREDIPHDEESTFKVGCDGCRNCHEDESDEYQWHGQARAGQHKDIPSCAGCHGDHDILPSTIKLSRVHPANLPNTCGQCHENLDLTRKYDILIDHPIEIYKNSVHGKVMRDSVYFAATCNDCHSTGGTAHRILSPGNSESTINHFNIPKTCGKCHKGVENDFWDGIHGKLVARGQTDAPVCTGCHGEHVIISPSDPRSPTSKRRLAEATCSPCHESATLNEKYGPSTGRLITFIDRYHGLKSKAGDILVANCASCHGVHRILPSSDSTSTINPGNLQATCGECHTGISVALAATPIHGVSGERLRTPVADVVEKIYISAIIVIIGLMVIHWLIDLVRQIGLVMSKRQVRRMTLFEVWQHTFLMISFLVLAVTGFSLRFNESWIAKLLFGWQGGFVLRGTVHRVAAVVFIITTIAHIIYLFTPRGKKFIRDIFPAGSDFKHFWQRIKYNLGYAKDTPRFKRFNYIEKVEYWALVWGTVIMIVTGLLLWFDNYVVAILPKGVLDVSLVIHYWEAWLATLAVLVWHLYSTIFNPQVYPMNPSWLTGKMPEEMYAHEHPEHIDEARRETEEWNPREVDKPVPSKEVD